ncbi:MAG: hypothetical protein K6F46_07200 [Desulfovibrio sp.]|nr:hypothetical protein [Desulfovibrio sp.]
MKNDRTEIFGAFEYDESMTYEELLSVEDRFIEDLGRLLQDACTEHVEFSPLGDALMFQCAFAGHKLYIFRKLAQEVAAVLPSGISGRIVCLAHNLVDQRIFWLTRGEWREESRAIPREGPEELRVWQVPTAPESDSVDAEAGDAQALTDEAEKQTPAAESDTQTSTPDAE